MRLRGVQVATRRLLAVVLAMTMLGSVVSTDVAADAEPSYPTGLTVRGSVNQIYVVDALAGATVTVQGGPTTVSPKPANADGATLFRGLTPGPYSVTVGTAAPQLVQVRDETYRPPASFYTDPARQLERDASGRPVDGYLETADGTLLDYRVDLPAEPLPNGKYDVVVVYSGYRAGLRPAEPWEDDGAGGGLIPMLVDEGYAVMGVNMRGSGCSGGAFDVMEPLVGLDGYDIVETLNAQPWVDDIAMAGGSWLGLSQLFVAETKPPHLDAIAPGAVVTDFYRDIVYPGGILNDGFPLGWAATRDATNAFPSSYGNTPPWDVDPDRRLPTEPGTTCRENQALRSENQITRANWVAHSTYDEYWKTRTADVSQIEVPTLLVDSWQDEQVGSRPAVQLGRFPPATKVRMIGTNGHHAAYTTGDVWQEVAAFLDVYLDDVDPVEPRSTYEQRPKVEIFLESDLQMEAPGRLLLPSFDSLAPEDRRTYTLGTDLRAEVGGSTTSSFRYTPTDTAWDQVSQDQATFISDPLTTRTVMAGSGSVDLRIKADAPDVDLQVTLSEVRPDGQEMLVQSGWLRASHRREEANPLATALRPYHAHNGALPNLTPNVWTDLRVELFPFAHVFRQGSRLRISVDAPGGAGQAFAWSWRALEGAFDVTISHGPDERSQVVLPVLADPQVTGLPEPLAPCPLIWQGCRPTPSIQSLTSRAITDGNLVTLDFESTGAHWGVAGIRGPRLLDDGGVGDVRLVLASGSTQFRAPPGLHRYTLSLANRNGVATSRTIEVDVPGFAGADPQRLPAQPEDPATVTWTSPGSTWWASVDGVGLHGSTPLTQRRVSIPAELLTPGSHLVTLVSCDGSGCSNHYKPVAPVAGTIIPEPAGKVLSGERNDSSLVATIQPDSGPPVRVYSPYPGIVWSPAAHGEVTAGQQIGLVIMSGNQEAKEIIVG